VHNKGTGPMRVTSVAIHPAGVFAVTTPLASMDIKPGKSAPMKITATPPAFGAYAATLVIQTAANGQVSVPLSATGAAHLHAGHVRVVIERHDGAALHGRAQIVVTGTHPVVAPATHTTAAAAGPNREECLIQNLEPGKYTLQLVTPGTYLGGAALTRIAPAQNGLLKVTIEDRRTAQRAYVLSPYDHMQLIAFHATPTGSNRPGNAISTYKGEAVEAQDMIARVELLKAGMAMAAAAAPLRHDDRDNVLKVFMAPEFYFRGASGGYPIEVMQEILSRLLVEAQKPAYKNWLFIYGSAIGYLRHEEVDPLGVAPATQIVHELQISHYTPGVLVPLQSAKIRVIRDPLLAPTVAAQVKPVCSRIPNRAWPPAAWTVWQNSDDEYELELFGEAGGAVAIGPFLLCEAQATEIFNVALLQKGGATPGGKRDLMVYKEWISSIDFHGAHSGGTNAANDFYTNAGANHTVDIHRLTDQLLIPTEGSTDMLTVLANPAAVDGVSEENRSGYGGGSLFSIGGVNIGMEICLDHLQARLFKYAPNATPGDSRPQALLIPSYGMTIGEAPSYVLPTGLVFNVDGRTAGASVPNVPPVAGTFTANRCPDHPHAGLAIVAPNTACPSNDHHTCAQHTLHYQAGPAACLRCNNALSAVDSCTGAHDQWFTNVCNTCKAAALPQIGLHCATAGHGYQPGVLVANCPLCLAPNPGIPKYRCNTPHDVIGACPEAGHVPVPTARHGCNRHPHTAYAAANCTHCGAMTVLEPRTANTSFVAAVHGGAVPVADPGGPFAVNDQTVLTVVEQVNINTGVRTHVSVTMVPAHAAPIPLPTVAPTRPDVVVEDMLARTRTSQIEWDLGDLTIVSIVAEQWTAIVNDVTTVTSVKTVTRTGNVPVAHARLLNTQPNLYFFPAAAIPNAEIV
jgi:hypothetical protein